MDSSSSARRTVWKFRLVFGRSDDVARVDMPVGARVLMVGQQDGDTCLWAEVNPATKRTEPRVFRMFGTGHEIKGDMGMSYEWVASWQEPPFVWHLYEHKGV